MKIIAVFLSTLAVVSLAQWGQQTTQHTFPLFNRLPSSLNQTSKVRSLNDALSCMAALTKLKDPESLIATLMNSGRNINDLGEWRTCGRDESRRYMAITLVITDYIPLSFYGFCGPKECEQEDYATVFPFVIPTLETVFGQMFNATLTGKVHLAASDPTKGIPNNNVDGWEISTFIFLGILGSLVLSTSVFHFIKSVWPPKEPNTAASVSDSQSALLINDDENNKSSVSQNPRNGRPPGEKRLSVWDKLVGCFALQNNFKKLFPETEYGDPSLSVFHGIRFFSTLWVIWGHQYFLRMQANQNVMEMGIFLKTSMMIVNFGGEFSVDVFLFMGGFFFGYVAFRRLTLKDVTIGNYIYLIVHRIWRLWPLMFLSLMFLWKIAKYMSSGPIGNLFAGFTDDQCKDYYWEILLFMQTLDRRNGNNCFSWAWYLACDMQIFLIMPMIGFLYVKNKNASKILCWILTIASVIYAFCISMAFDFNAQSLLIDPDGYYHWWYYYPAWTRIPPYTFGILVCDWYLTNKKTPKEEQSHFIQKFRKSTFTQWFCTLLGFSIMAFLVGIIEPTLQNPQIYTKFENALYASTSRLLYVVGLTLFIFPALAGEGKWLVSIMGNRVFAVMGRLTFSMYLIHATILAIFIFSDGKLRHEDHPQVFFDVFAMFFIITLASMVVYLCIELPLANLEGFFLKGGKGKKGNEAKEVREVKEGKAEEAG